MTWTLAQSGESPEQLWANYYQNSRLSNGFADSEGLLGVATALTMPSIAAYSSGLTTLSGALSAGSFGINATLTASAGIAAYNKDKVTLGDKAKLGFNAVLTVAGWMPYAAVPAAALGILDHAGFFEPIYTQLDIYEAEGQWIYYNMYTNSFNSKKI